MRQTKIIGTVLKLTDQQLSGLMKEVLEKEFVNEIPAGLIDRFISRVVEKAKKVTKENGVFWDSVLKQLEKGRERKRNLMYENLLD